MKRFSEVSLPSSSLRSHSHSSLAFLSHLPPIRKHLFSYLVYHSCISFPKILYFFYTNTCVLSNILFFLTWLETYQRDAQICFSAFPFSYFQYVLEIISYQEIFCIHSFSFLKTCIILLHGVTPSHLSNNSMCGHLGCFQYSAVTNNAAMNNQSCACEFSYFWRNIFRVNSQK